MKRDLGLEDRVCGLLTFCCLLVLIIAAFAIAGLIRMCASQWQWR
jgi:hypothetical protein